MTIVTEQEQNTNQEADNQQSAIDKSTKEKEIKQSRTALLSSLLNETTSTDNIEDDELEVDDKKSTKRDDKKSTKVDFKAKTLKELAEVLDVEVEKLYEVSVKLSENGEPVTLSKLKDFYQEGDEFNLKQIEWGESKVKQELELAHARKEIEVLASLLPKESLKPESMAKAREIVMNQIAKQREELFRRVPEWKDEDTRKLEITEIDEHLKSYGLTFNELSDARTAHYIRNAWLREKRITKALEKVTQVKPKATPPSGSKPTKSKARRDMSERAKNISRNFID